MARFAMTYCSQCGCETGPGDAGFSRCADHRAKAREKALNLIRLAGLNGDSWRAESLRKVNNISLAAGRRAFSEGEAMAELQGATA